jgi:hypothetical protein
MGSAGIGMGSALASSIRFAGVVQPAPRYRGMQSHVEIAPSSLGCRMDDGEAARPQQLAEGATSAQPQASRLAPSCSLRRGD